MNVDINEFDTVAVQYKVAATVSADAQVQVGVAHELPAAPAVPSMRDISEISPALGARARQRLHAFLSSIHSQTWTADDPGKWRGSDPSSGIASVDLVPEIGQLLFFDSDGKKLMIAVATTPVQALDGQGKLSQPSGYCLSLLVVDAADREWTALVEINTETFNTAPPEDVSQLPIVSMNMLSTDNILYLPMRGHGKTLGPDARVAYVDMNGDTYSYTFEKGVLSKIQKARGFCQDTWGYQNGDLFSLEKKWGSTAQFHVWTQPGGIVRAMGREKYLQMGHTLAGEWSQAKCPALHGSGVQLFKVGRADRHISFVVLTGTWINGAPHGKMTRHLVILPTTVEVEMGGVPHYVQVQEKDWFFYTKEYIDNRDDPDWSSDYVSNPQRMDFEEVWEHGRFISVETTTKATDPVSVRYLPEDTGLRIQFSAKSGAVGLGLMHSGYFVYPYAPDATGVNIEFGSENFIGDRARVCFSHNTSRCRQLVDTSVPQWKNTGPFGLESTEFMDFSGIEIRVNDDPVEVVEWRKYPAGWNALRESGGTLTYHHVAAGPFGGDAEGVSRVESTIQIGSAQSSPEHSAEDVLARIGDDFDNKRVPDASSERGEYFRRQKLALRAKSEQHPALAIFDTLISWEAQEQPGLGDLERKIAENEQSRKALLQDKAEERQSQFKTLGREEALGQAVILLSKWTGWLQANADALKAIEAEAKKAQAMAEYRRGLDALGIYTAEEIDAMCQDAESKEPQAATAGTRANTGNKNSKKSKKKPKGKGKKKK